MCLNYYAGERPELHEVAEVSRGAYDVVEALEDVSHTGSIVSLG
jgi:hypothetical protein